MTTMRSVLTFVILTVAAFGVFLTVERYSGTAARCAVSTFEIELERSDAVFVGVVKKIEKDGNRKTFTFEVDRYWKGDGSREIKVNVYENPRFQAQFAENGRFLVFAKPDGEDGKDGLMDGRCSRSKDLDRFPEGAKEDLLRLGEGKEPEKNDKGVPQQI